jgi:hypothetical protein
VTGRGPEGVETVKASFLSRNRPVRSTVGTGASGRVTSTPLTTLVKFWPSAEKADATPERKRAETNVI